MYINFNKSFTVGSVEEWNELCKMLELKLGLPLNSFSTLHCKVWVFCIRVIWINVVQSCSYICMDLSAQSVHLQHDYKSSCHWSVFYRPYAFPVTQPTVSQHWMKKKIKTNKLSIARYHKDISSMQKWKQRKSTEAA